MDRLVLRTLGAVLLVGLAARPSAQPTVDADTVLRPTTLYSQGDYGYSVAGLGTRHGARYFGVGAIQNSAGAAADIGPGEVYIYQYSTIGGLGVEWVIRASDWPEIPNQTRLNFGSTIAGVYTTTTSHTNPFIAAVGEDIPDGSGGTLSNAGRVYAFDLVENDSPFAILTSPTPAANAYFGTTLASVPDVTGDGNEDILVHAREDGTSTALTSEGFAGLFDGRSGAFVRSFAPPLSPGSSDLLGRGLAGLNDIDGDGRGDVVIGIPGQRRISVYSGATGALLYTAAQTATRLGESLSRTSDHDGDGFDDFWAGAPGVPAVYLFSGATGDLLLSIPSSRTNFGSRVENAGDLNGDGVEDVLIGYGRSYRFMDLHDGVTGGFLVRLESSVDASNSDFGDKAAHVGDLDLNGTPDYVVGAWSDSRPGEPPYPGAAYVFLSDASAASLAGPQGWRLGSAPLIGLTYGAILGPLWMQGVLGADLTSGTPTLYTYDETASGTDGWVVPASMGSVSGLGRGFAYFAFADDDLIAPGVQGGFPKALSVGGFEAEGEVGLPVSYTNTGSLPDDGWNLVGNPYSAAIDWGSGDWVRVGVDNVAYTYDPVSETYQTWNGTTGTAPDGLIDPFEGFWVKAYASSVGGSSLELTVTPAAQSSGAGSIVASSLVLEATATVAGTERTGRAAVMLHPEALDGHDAFDAYALTPFAPSYVALHTVDAEGALLDINAVPLASGTVEIPLDVWVIENDARVPATVTLRWPDLSTLSPEWTLSLLDTQTGQETDLRTTASYTASLSTAGRVASSDPSAKAAIPAPRPLRAGSPEARTAGTRFILRLSASSVATDAGRGSTFGITEVRPNPIGGQGTVVVHLDAAGPARLALYDVLGREVTVLREGPLAAGRHEVAFDPAESGVAAGAYVLRWQAGGRAVSRTVTVLR